MRLLVIALALLLPAHAWPALIISNGAAVEADLGLRYNFAQYTIYDQFVLSGRTMLTGVEWSQFDEAILYQGSTLSFFSGLPGSSTLIRSFDLIGSRLANGLDVVTDKATDVIGYDYFADFRLMLGPGEYFLGIHNDVSGGQTLMANSRGTPQSVYGSYQSISGLLEFNNADFAFRLYGNAVPVAEPGSMGLLLAGAISLILVRGTRVRNARVRAA